MFAYRDNYTPTTDGGDNVLKRKDVPDASLTGAPSSEPNPTSQRSRQEKEQNRRNLQRMRHLHYQIKQVVMLWQKLSPALLDPTQPVTLSRDHQDLARRMSFVNSHIKHTNDTTLHVGAPVFLALLQSYCARNQTPHPLDELDQVKLLQWLIRLLPVCLSFLNRLPFREPPF